jgi:hypothetical protein
MGKQMKLPILVLLGLLAGCSDSQKDIANCEIINNTVNTSYEYALLAGNEKSYSEIEKEHDKTRQAIPNCKFPTQKERSDVKKCSEIISKISVARTALTITSDQEIKLKNQEIIKTLEPVMKSIPSCKYPYAI